MTTQFAPRWTDATRSQTCIVGNATDIASASTSTLLDLQVGGVSKFAVDKFGELIIAPTARTSGSDSLLSLIAPADTARAAGIEATDINLNLARTVQFSAGAIANQRAVRIQAPTYSFDSASTITNASTLSISGAPVAGTNATITNRRAVRIESGDLEINNGNLVLVDTDANLGARPVSNIYLKRRLIMTGRDNYFTNLIQFSEYGCLHGLNYNGFGWGTESAVNGWCNGASWFGKVNVASWGWGLGGNDFTSGFHCPTAHVIQLRGGVNAQTFQTYNTYTDSSNYERLSLQFGTFSSKRYAQIAAESAGTGTANIDLVLSPRGTGSFSLHVPDGTATGGNARGAYAVDLQTFRGAATEVASGAYSFACNARGTVTGDFCWVGGGNTNGGSTVSGASNFAFGREITNNAPFYSAAFGYIGQMGSSFSFAAGTGFSCTGGEHQFSFGRSNVNTGSYNLTVGEGAKADKTGQIAFAAGAFANAGDAQSSQYVLRAKTTNNTPTTLLLGPATNAVASRLTIPSGKIMHVLVIVIGSKSDGSAVALYMRQVAIKNVGGTTSLVGTVNTLGTDTAAGTSLAITADNTNKALDIAPTGVASETWRWQVTVYGSELAFGT